MTGYVALLSLVATVGFLIWVGSGSIAKAVAGGILIPLFAFIVLGMLLGKDGLQSIGGPGILVAVIMLIAAMVWRRSRS